MARPVSATAALLLLAPPALACPNCPTARAARAAMLGEAFWPNLGMTLAPLLLLVAICLRLYRIGAVNGPSQ